MSALSKQRFGWYLYDFANSGFTTSVVTVFFGPYLTALAVSAATRGVTLSIAGVHIHPGSLYALCVSSSVLLQVVVLPLLGAFIDRTHFKRLSLFATATIGSLCTVAMFLITSETPHLFLIAPVLFIMANLCFGASIVASNSFLTDLADEHERDAVSSRGWAIGYLGGGLLLAIHLVLYAQGVGVQWLLSSTGLWWLAFAIVSVRLLRDPVVTQPMQRKSSIKQLLNTLRHMREHPRALHFLVAYLLYNETVQTVIAMAGVYGSQQMGLGLEVLTKGILLVQFVAILGSMSFNALASRIGTKESILWSIAGWVVVIILALVIPNTEASFYGLASCIALVLGGTQALSRSFFSTVIPHGFEGEYFALYEMSDKGTSWIGPLLFGLMVTLTSNYQIALVSLLVFLIAGGSLLLRLPSAHSVETETA